MTCLQRLHCHNVAHGMARESRSETALTFRESAKPPDPVPPDALRVVEAKNQTLAREGAQGNIAEGSLLLGLVGPGRCVPPCITKETDALLHISRTRSCVGGGQPSASESVPRMTGAPLS